MERAEPAAPRLCLKGIHSPRTTQTRRTRSTSAAISNGGENVLCRLKNGAEEGIALRNSLRTFCG